MFLFCVSRQFSQQIFCFDLEQKKQSLIFSSTYKYSCQSLMGFGFYILELSLDSKTFCNIRSRTFFDAENKRTFLLYYAASPSSRSCTEAVEVQLLEQFSSREQHRRAPASMHSDGLHCCLRTFRLPAGEKKKRLSHFSSSIYLFF